MKTGEAILLSFPFWLYTDSRTPPLVEEISQGGAVFRFYPPFRSADANFSPMPPIRSDAVPFLTKKKFKVSIPLIHAVSLPTLSRDGKPGVIVVWSAQLKEELSAFPMDSLRIDLFNDSCTTNVDDLIRKLLERLRVRSGQW